MRDAETKQIEWLTLTPANLKRWSVWKIHAFNFFTNAIRIAVVKKLRED